MSPCDLSKLHRAVSPGTDTCVGRKGECPRGHVTQQGVPCQCQASGYITLRFRLVKLVRGERVLMDSANRPNEQLVSQDPFKSDGSQGRTSPEGEP